MFVESRMAEDGKREGEIDICGCTCVEGISFSWVFNSVFQVMFCNARQQVTCVNLFLCALTFARAAGGVLFQR